MGFRVGSASQSPLCWLLTGAARVSDVCLTPPWKERVVIPDHNTRGCSQVSDRSGRVQQTKNQRFSIEAYVSPEWTKAHIIQWCRQEGFLSTWSHPTPCPGGQGAGEMGPLRDARPQEALWDRLQPQGERKTQDTMITFKIQNQVFMTS